MNDLVTFFNTRTLLHKTSVQNFTWTLLYGLELITDLPVPHHNICRSFFLRQLCHELKSRSMKSRQSRVDPHFNDLSCCCFSNLCSHNKQQGIFRNLKINNNNIKNQNWEQPGMSLLACTYVLGSLYVIVAVKWFICNAVSIYSIAVDQNLLEYCFSEKNV